MPDSNGIPKNINISTLKKWVEGRVSTKRFKHICGVAVAARTIAAKHGCDPELAEIAAWLHDCCKEMKERELLEAAKTLNVPFTEIEEKHGHLLHGPVAAAVVKKELGIKNQDVLNAISEHTLGNAPMCPLSEVLYLADCLEEGRDTNYTAPIWAALDLDGEFNIAKAIVIASNLGLIHLVESGRPIHPRAVMVRNYYLECATRKESACH